MWPRSACATDPFAANESGRDPRLPRAVEGYGQHRPPAQRQATQDPVVGEENCAGEKVTLAGRGARDGTPLTGPVLVRVVLGEETAA